MGRIADPDRRGLLEGLLRLLKETFGEGLMSVVVFGSVARGDAKPSSDIDVLVVARNMPKSMMERMELMAKLMIKLEGTDACRKLRERGVSTWVQLHPLWSEEAKLHRPIYLDMVDDAVILLDRDGFIEAILKGLKKRLGELKAKRVYLRDGSWFWDLKPDIKRGEVVEI
ncbi:MAG: nucleotidyltransferase domain-containing protein [Candidatus Bathyarchaeia archaeon]|nr:nucleotidyltransferase domain-containing protein [Candidatus Bathyarchaeota archaeon]